MKYEEIPDDICIALSKEAADKYVNELTKNYPDAYSNKSGKFFYEYIPFAGY